MPSSSRVSGGSSELPFKHPAMALPCLSVVDSLMAYALASHLHKSRCILRRFPRRRHEVQLLSSSNGLLNGKELSPISCPFSTPVSAHGALPSLLSSGKLVANSFEGEFSLCTSSDTAVLSLTLLLPPPSGQLGRYSSSLASF